MTTKNDSNKFLFVTTMLNNPEFTQKVVKMNKSKTCMLYHHIRKLKSNGIFKWLETILLTMPTYSKQNRINVDLHKSLHLDGYVTWKQKTSKLSL